MQEFIAAWRLISFEELQTDGSTSYPYGKDAVGLLLYDATGKMSVQIMRRDRTDISSNDSNETSPEEIKSIVEGFTAFFGTYEINYAEKIITHKVEGHLLPNSVGKPLKRSFEFSGDRLILKPTQSRRVIWERIMQK